MPSYICPKCHQGNCTHPPSRLFAWFAKDARAKYPGGRDKKTSAFDGEVLCVACCDCGEVLAGVMVVDEDDKALTTDDQHPG